MGWDGYDMRDGMGKAFRDFSAREGREGVGGRGGEGIVELESECAGLGWLWSI